MEGEEGEAPLVEEQVFSEWVLRAIRDNIWEWGCYSFAGCECMARQMSDTDAMGKHMRDDE